MSKLSRMAAIWTSPAAYWRGAGFLAAPSTRAAAPTITIAATSKLEVAGDAVVLFRAANGAYTTAKISGKISGAPSGSVVKLYAQPFPYRKSARSIASAPAGSRYSFTVKPAIATRYYAVPQYPARPSPPSGRPCTSPQPASG